LLLDLSFLAHAFYTLKVIFPFCQRQVFYWLDTPVLSYSFSREVIEFALSHQLPDKVESAYQRGTVFDKRIPLMQSWADYCYKAQETASVTPIRSAVK